MAKLVCGLVFLVANAAWAQPVPSKPHPRLWMRPADVAGYKSAAQSPTSTARALIAQCQRAIDQPQELANRGGVNGDYWPATVVACAFAYRVTGQKTFFEQALKYWRVSLNDDMTVGDGLGCTPQAAAKDWRTSWKGEPPAPPALLTVTHDTWYPIRWFGPALALAYDWLYSDVDEPLRAQTRSCLTSWIDAYTRFGYLRADPGANYHAGFLFAKVLGAIAIGSDGGADGHLWREALDLFAKQLVDIGLAGTTGGLGQPAGLLVGGDWGSWQYGPLSVLEYAVATRAIEENGVPQPAMDAWLHSVMIRTLHGLVPRMDHQFTGNGDYEGEGAEVVYPKIHINQLDAVLAGPSTDEAAAWALFVRQQRRLTGTRFWNALAELRAVTPKDYRAQKPPPPLWYVARGVGNLYARTSWADDALWAVFMSGSPKADHAHLAASNFVLSRGGDHLIVDSSNYGQFGTLGTNAVSADSGAPREYATTQGPWGMPSLPLARATTDRVVAARSDFARSFEFNGQPSKIKLARRDWALLPEGEVVTIDRVVTGDANRKMYLNFHFNTGGTLGLDAAGLAIGTVGDSRVALHRVQLPGGVAKIVKTPAGGCPGDCSYPCGSCTAARFAVDVYTASVAGPSALAIHVFDALAKTEPPAKVVAVNDPSIDAQNIGVIGAAINRASKQSYVIASADGSPPKQLRYVVPGAAARHVVFDAPDSDGSSQVATTASNGRCVVTIAAGSGVRGQPLIFELTSADTGCKVQPAADAPAAIPLSMSSSGAAPSSPDLHDPPKSFPYRYVVIPVLAFVAFLIAMNSLHWLWKARVRRRRGTL